MWFVRDSSGGIVGIFSTVLTKQGSSQISKGEKEMGSGVLNGKALVISILLFWLASSRELGLVIAFFF